jgi:hypothetical protein
VKTSGLVLFGWSALFASFGCSSDGAPTKDETVTKPKAPPEDVLGKGGAGDSVEFTPVYTPMEKNTWSATALDFNPARPSELWVLLRRFPSGLPCTQNDPRGCAALEGQVAIVQDPGGDAPDVTLKKDPNAWHFMRRPTSIAFDDDDTFASCGEARTDNYEDENVDYSGPVLWSADPEIFAIEPPGKNGSHIDMLHDSPFCMGIAHEDANVYWAFNGQVGALDRYDFKKPHEVGGEDHSDGEFLRYALGQVQRSPEIPSHLAYDATDASLYIADTGHGRVARLDTTTGTQGRDVLTNDPIDLHARMDGAVLDDFVAPGALSAPSGVRLYRDTVFVTDNTQSTIHAYAKDGTELRSLDTGLPAGSLAGIAISDDGVAYVSDLATGRVLRLDVPGG